MSGDATILLGRGEAPQVLALRFANRHGLITGAPGTGKTVSMQVLIEGYSAHGVPVFVTDVKGDLSGLCRPGSLHAGIDERVQAVRLERYERRGFPVAFWDMFGEHGHPIRTTISEMGPLLLARLLGLNGTQQEVLGIAFTIADQHGLLLLDLKDLRTLMNFVSERVPEVSLKYGRVSTASIGAIQRRLLTLEQQGGAQFFGEPALAVPDLMRTDPRGHGIISVLAADRLIMTPKLYATFVLWLLAELFEELPVVGDAEKPKLVFFFEEAHLLFTNAPKVLLEKVEQVVRLIRWRGVGIYFVTQNPRDLPDDVLRQLDHRVQHALRPFAPRDQDTARVAAKTFRADVGLDEVRATTELAVGEALVSTRQDKGVPSVIERALIRPPASRIGPATAEERSRELATGPLSGRYDKAIDRKSAREILKRRAEHELARQDPDAGRAAEGRRGTACSGGQSIVEALASSAARSIGHRIGGRISRGVLGSILKR